MMMPISHHNPLILLWDRKDKQKLSLVTLPLFTGVQARLTIISALASLKSSPDPPGNTPLGRPAAGVNVRSAKVRRLLLSVHRPLAPLFPGN